jgi:predicted membrane protein
VLAAPVALLGVGAYAFAKKRKDARLAAALGTAIGKLYAIQERLLANAENFKNEIITIRATIDFLLTKKRPA